MKINQLSAILYTVRDFIDSRNELDRTLGKIADIGFNAVEICGVDDEVASPTDIARLCQKHGLVISSAHENWDLIVNDPHTAASRVKDLGCDYICYPWPGSVEITDAPAISGLISSLAGPAKVMAKHGLQLCYHNHAVEFMKYEGRPLLERVFEIPRLQVQLDTYWTQLGGADPIKTLMNWRGRIPLIHLKDMGAYGNEACFREIGRGNLDFKGIVSAAEKAGTKWFVVEQDQTWGRDPFEAIADSFAYIRDHLVSAQA